MEQKVVSLRIKGKNEQGETLSPETLDIIEVQAILGTANKLVSGDVNKQDRGVIGLKYEEGSALFSFVLSASLATSFNADLRQITTGQNLESIAVNRAVSVIELQEKAKKLNWEFEITGTDSKEENAVKITKDTKFALPPSEWIEVEKVLYGELTDIGGSSTSNLHVKVEEGKTITIPATKEETEKVNDAVKVYHPIGVLVSALENRKTGELDKGSIKFIATVPFEENIKEQLEKSMNIGSDVWKNVPNSSDWIREKRNNYE